MLGYVKVVGVDYGLMESFRGLYRKDVVEGFVLLFQFK
jgi:hypothetical protein